LKRRWKNASARQLWQDGSAVFGSIKFRAAKRGRE
jgi:hypothetical protein